MTLCWCTSDELDRFEVRTIDGNQRGHVHIDFQICIAKWVCLSAVRIVLFVGVCPLLSIQQASVVSAVVVQQMRTTAASKLAPHSRV